MISFVNVTRRFGDHTVLENLSFHLPNRGIVAMMAPSGAGKTTLLRLMAGLDRPDAGNVQCRAKRIAVSFQEPRLIPWLSCAENIKFVLSKNKEGCAEISRLLECFELSEAENALPDTLSGGMRQRLSLARALAVQPDLLLLDEPFNGMDDALKERLYPLIKTAVPKGLCVIVTHDEREATALGAHILRPFGSPIRSLRG